MKIALVQDRLRMGGTERQTIALANAFSAAGHEVMLVTFRPGGVQASDVSPKVLRLSLQRNDLGLDWFAPGIARVLRGFGAQIVQLMGRMANAHGWRLIKALPTTRVVATLRTGKDIPLPYRITLRQAAAVVTNSADAARRLAAAKYKISGSRVHVIRNAVAVPGHVSPEAREKLRAELHTRADAIVFLCVAMMRPGKGQDSLIEMASKLRFDRPWELWLAGEGPELVRCMALSTRLDLDEHVRFLGLRQDTAVLCSAADIAVLASDTESLPNFLVEAQWHALPVVAFDVAGVSETFVPGKSGTLVRAGDAEGFCRALEQLATDTALRAHMSIAACEHARREFDPEQQHRRYLELYETLLG